MKTIFKCPCREQTQNIPTEKNLEMSLQRKILKCPCREKSWNVPAEKIFKMSLQRTIFVCVPDKTICNRGMVEFIHTSDCLERSLHNAIFKSIQIFSSKVGQHPFNLFCDLFNLRTLTHGHFWLIRRQIFRTGYKECYNL